MGQDRAGTTKKSRLARWVNLLLFVLLLGVGIWGLFVDWLWAFIGLGLAFFQLRFGGVLGSKQADVKLPFRLDL
jgi:hypothetical protein